MKKGQKWAKKPTLEKQPYFLSILLEFVENKKKNSFPKWSGFVEEKNHFSKKNGFLAVFVILPKSQKWPKIHFFLRKVDIFLVHQNNLWKRPFEASQRFGENFFLKKSLISNFFGPNLAPFLTLEVWKWMKYRFSENICKT